MEEKKIINLTEIDEENEGSLNEKNKDHTEWVQKGIKGYIENIKKGIISKPISIGSGFLSIINIKFSPNGQFFAVICYDKRGLRYYNVETHRLEWYSDVSRKRFKTLQFLAEGKKLITSAEDNFIRTFNTDDGNVIESLDLSFLPNIESLCFHENENFFLLGLENGNVCLHKWPSGLIVKTIKFHTKSVNEIVFDSKEEFFATSSFDEKWCLIKTKTMEIELESDERYHSGGFTSIKFSPDDRWLVTSGIDKKVKVFDISKKIVLDIFQEKLHENYVESLIFTKISKNMITCSEDGYVKIWNTKEKGKEIGCIFNEKYKGLICIDISHDESKIIVASYRHILLYDFTTKQLINDYFSGFERDLSKALFNSDGSVVLSLSIYENMIKINDAETGEELAESQLLACLDESNNPLKDQNNKLIIINYVDFTMQTSNDYGSYLRYCVSYSRSDSKYGVACFECERQKNENTFKNKTKLWDRLFDEKISSILYSPDGKMILGAAYEASKIYVLDNKSGENQKSPFERLPISEINYIIFSSDGNKFLFCGNDKKIYIYDIKEFDNKNSEAIKTNHIPTIITLDISFDYKLIASLDKNGIVILSDLTKKKEIFQFNIPNVQSVAFSKYGDKLVTGGENLIIWDLETKKKLIDIPYGYQWVKQIHLSKDGKKFMSVSSYIDIFKTHDGKEDKKFFGKKYFEIKKIQFNFAEDKYMFINSLNQFQVFDSKTNEKISGCCLSFKENDISNFILDEHEKFILFLGEFFSIYKLNDFKKLEEIKTVIPSPLNCNTRTGEFSKKLKETILIGSDDGRVRHLNYRLEIIKESDVEKKHKDWVREISVHPKRNEIFSASDDSTIIVWKEETLEFLRIIKPGHKAYIYCISLSSDGNLLFSGTTDNELFVHDANKEGTHLIKKIESGGFHTRNPITIKPNSKGDLLLTTSCNGELKIWRKGDYSLAKEFKFYKGSICNFNKDGSKILTASGGEIKIIRLNQKWEVEEKVKEEFKSSIYNILVTPDEKKIVAVGENDLTIFTFVTGEILKKINIENGLIELNVMDVIQGSRDECFLIVPFSSGNIKIYDINSDNMEIEKKSFTLEGETLINIKFLNETTIILVNTSIRIFDIQETTANLICQYQLEKAVNVFDYFIEENNEKSMKLTFSSDSKIYSKSLILEPSSEKSKTIANVFDPVQPIPNNNVSYQAAKYSQNGDRIYFLSKAYLQETNYTCNNVLVLDSSSGYVIRSHSIKAESSELFGTFSHDCRLLSFWDKNQVKIIDTEFFIEKTCSNEFLSNLCSMKFTKDSKTIITVSDSTRISFLETNTEGSMNDFLIIYEKLKMAEMNNSELNALDVGQIFNKRINVFELLGSEYPLNILHLVCLYNDEKVLKHFLKNINNENSDTFYSLLNHRNFLDYTPYQMAIACGNTKLIESLIRIHIKTNKQSRYFSGYPFQIDTLNIVLNYYPSYLASVLDSQICTLSQRKFINLSLELEGKTFLDKFKTKFIHMNTIKSSIQNNIKGNAKEVKKMAFNIQVVVIDDILLPKNSFMTSISENLNEDHNIFDSLAFSAILEYKWKHFGKKQFYKSLFRYLIYFALVLISSLILFPMRRFTFLPSDTKKEAVSQQTGASTANQTTSILSQTHSPNSTLDIGNQKHPPELYYDQNAVFIASMIFDIAILIYLYLAIFSYEIKVLLIRKSKYFNNGIWNILDALIIIFGTTSMIFDIILLTQSHDPEPKTAQILKFLFFLNLLITWMRMADFLRGFRNTAALVRLLTRVFADMKAFFLVLFYLLLGFSMSTYLLQNNYEEFGKWGFIKMYYNIILGNTDDFESMTKATSVFEDLFFIIFFLLTVFLIVVMLNLLIAIVSDTNSKVTSVEAKAFQFERLNLINEYEEIIGEAEANALSEDHRSYYLYVVKSSKEISDDDEDMNIDKKSPSDKMDLLFGEINNNKESMQNILEFVKKNHEDAKSSQEQNNQNQEEMKKSTEEMKKSIEEMKKYLEGMKNSQGDMKKSHEINEKSHEVMKSQEIL